MFSQTTFAGTLGGARSNNYPNPFRDLASLSMPTNIRSALYWAEYVYSSFGTYNMANERIISYFMTEIEVENTSDEDADKWTDFLAGPINAITGVKGMLRNVACYGNGFASVVVPFKRFLVCSRCGYFAPLSTIAKNPHAGFHFVPSADSKRKSFQATCPGCKHGPQFMTVRDEKHDVEDKIRIKLWNPHEIELLHDPYTDDVAYLWRIPEDYKAMVRRGNLYHLERAPTEVLDAIHNNQMFRFADDVIFHMKEPCLAGIYNRGWGLPRILVNFRQIYYVQVLRRFNEAIALDYVIPFRVITPAPAQGRTGGGTGLPLDPLVMFNGGDFRQQVENMIRRRRRDPAGMHVLPFPVNFQMFGADATKLAPRDLMDQGTEQLLNDIGTPVELYKGTLQLQTAPVALRLFESTFHQQVHDANMFVDWVGRQSARALDWEEAKLKMRRVTLADDIEKQMMLAQLAMSQQVSGTTMLAGLGRNWKKEQLQIASEAQFQAELQAKTQEELEQQGMAAQMAKGQAGQGQAGPGGPGGPGGAPAPGGGAAVDPSQAAAGGPVTQYLMSVSPNTPQSPQDMVQAAQALAQELLGQPEGLKRSELRKLTTYNKPMADLVRQQMDELRSSVRQQAGNQAVASLGSGQPAA